LQVHANVARSLAPSAPVGGVRPALHGGAAGDDDGFVLPQLGHHLRGGGAVISDGVRKSSFT
jgi:hypothetical protein